MSATRDQVAIHPLLAQRRSPRAFDPRHELSAEELTALLEAARWAPSSTNSQPWRYLVGRRGDAVFTALHAALSEGNRTWAARASALLLAVAEVRGPEGAPRSHAAWDVGQSVAHLTLQAGALGLAVRQMGGFDPEAASASLGVPAGFAALTVVAVGRPQRPAEIPADLHQRETAPRVRKPLEEVAFSTWGQPLAG